MPKDLPGFFWDNHRNRYFPISTKPSNPQSGPHRPPQLSHPPHPQLPPTLPTTHPSTPSSSHFSPVSRNHPRRSIWHLTSLGITQGSLFTLHHDLLGLHVASTSNLAQQRLAIFGHIRNFISTTTPDGHIYRLLGDNRGWIYSQHQHPLRDGWTVEANLDQDSEISSLAICDDTFSLATSFGLVSKIRISKVNDPNLSHIISSPNCHDIRCSSYTTPNDLVVGAKQHAVYFTDVLHQPRTRDLKTHSDVFSVTRQHQNLVYAGTRNGSIHRFDLRIPNDNNNMNKTIIFTDKSRPKSTVLHMQIIDEYQFLTSRMNGELLMYDIRYTREHNTQPILQFPGHVNTHTSHLGITISPDSQFLFAASQDRTIRGWSLRTGDPLVPSLPPPPPVSSSSSLSSSTNSPNEDPDLEHHARNPLSMVFDEPVGTLQITWEDENHWKNSDWGDTDRSGRRMCLWAGCKDVLYKFGLGCR